MHASLKIPGHLALWPGLYVAAAALMLARLAGVSLPMFSIIILALASAAAFTLDRVKLTKAHHDPADAHAQPARYAFLRAWDTPVRLGALATIGLGIAASLVAGSPSVALAILTLTVLVVIYATPTGRRRRIKDVLLVKNASVGMGIAGAATLAAGTLSPAPVLALVAIATADAMLCDLDDIEADRAAGTATIPARLGPSAALAIASALHVAALVLLIVPIETLVLDRAVSLARAVSIAVVLIAPALACRALGAPVRDIVDARLLLAALLLPAA